MVDNYENYQFLLEKYEIIETIIEKTSREWTKTFLSTTKNTVKQKCFNE